MASVTHTGGKSPVPSSIPRKSQFEKSRCDTSLSLLTKRFAELLKRSTDGVLDLNVVSQELNAPKRRVYDVTNVLEGIHLIKKKSKNRIEWLGDLKAHLSQDLSDLTEEEKKLDELIQSCTQQVHQMCQDSHTQRFAYLTYEDVQRIPSLQEQTVIMIKAPAETKLEVPHPEESFQVYLSSTQGPIEVFLCSDKSIPMDTSSASVANSSHLQSSTTGTSAAHALNSYLSVLNASSKDDANHTFGISSVSNLLSESIQHSSEVTVPTVSPMPPSFTSLQPPSEDQQSLVILTPPLAFSLSGEDYMLNLAENEGITDLFNSVDLEHLPLEMPIL